MPAGRAAARSGAQLTVEVADGWTGPGWTALRNAGMIGPPPKCPTMHLDRGYDSGKTRDLLEVLGDRAEIAVKGQPVPIQAGSAGRSSGPTRERMATASCAAALPSAR